MNQRKDAPIVVIGYGSSLRGDDAVGRLVVESISDRHLPDVETWSVTQLLPELVPVVAAARAAIFVDACIVAAAQTVELKELTVGPSNNSSSHMSAPCEILSLAAACYNASPPAWLVSVPTTCFEFTEELSSEARTFVAAAVHRIEDLIHRSCEREVAHA